MSALVKEFNDYRARMNEVGAGGGVLGGLAGMSLVSIVRPGYYLDITGTEASPKGPLSVPIWRRELDGTYTGVRRDLDRSSLQR